MSSIHTSVQYINTVHVMKHSLADGALTGDDSISTGMCNLCHGNVTSLHTVMWQVGHIAAPPNHTSR